MSERWRLDGDGSTHPSSFMMIAENVYLLATARNRAPAGRRNRSIVACRKRADRDSAAGLKLFGRRCGQYRLRDNMRFRATDAIYVHFGATAVLAHFCSCRRSFWHRASPLIVARTDACAAGDLK